MKEDTSQELRVRILDEAARQFDKKGIKFTMDDLAHALGMSKKTIYTVFEDKRSIMTQTIDRFFDDALTEEEAILEFLDKFWTVLRIAGQGIPWISI